MNRCRHIKTVLMVDDTYLINLRDHLHVIQGSDSDQDAAVNLEASVLLNEEGIIQGSIKLYGEYYKPAPLKSQKKINMPRLRTTS